MSTFLEPKDMNAVQKMKYLSTVSKVCKEMQSRLGFSDKSVAAIIVIKYHVMIYD